MNRKQLLDLLAKKNATLPAGKRLNPFGKPDATIAAFVGVQATKPATPLSAKRQATVQAIAKATKALKAEGQPVNRQTVIQKLKETKTAALQTGAQQAGSAVRREIYKAGFNQAIIAAGAAIPQHALVASLLGAATDAVVKKAVSTHEADAITNRAGKTIGTARHTPEQSKVAQAVNQAMAKLPEMAAKMGTTQLLLHGLQAAMVHGLHVDPGVSAAVSHVAAAALEPVVRQKVSELVDKVKTNRSRRYATT